MNAPSRLSGFHIVVLRNLVKRSGGQPVTLDRKFRNSVMALWRRALVQIWYRQSANSSLEGPFYSLTISGTRLAAMFCQPRENPESGASRSRGGV